MTRWPASWAADSVDASTASGLCTTAGFAAALRALMTEAAAFRTSDPKPDSDRCVAECECRPRGSAFAFVANTTMTAAARGNAADSEPVLLVQCEDRLFAKWSGARQGIARIPVRQPLDTFPASENRRTAPRWRNGHVGERAYRAVHSGTKTISSSAVQASDATTGWSSGHAPFAGAAGLPNIWRVAAARALTGFQSAT